ncbi:MAG TPA: DUF362 domain-containing protein [Chthoniobacteraceae bacterium]|nr:DUF362 domain-containing protein [Chthoniobacteraceae bacterium]
MHEIEIALQSGGDLSAFLERNLPEGDFRNVVLKPNWVKHQEHPEFPIEALVTSTALIDACIEACLRKYPRLKKITVGDVPLQICDWAALVKQAGLDRLMDKYRGRTEPVVQFLDLRRERWTLVDGFLTLDSDHPGDPLGYSEIIIDHNSLLEEVSHNADSFRVSDYDPAETVSVHRKGVHRYLVARTILEADLLINLPKMKTHQKAGVTGALKNLVGINGSKAHLVHHQLGFPSQGGDEFPENVSRLFYYQARLRERFQKKSKLVFQGLKRAWELIKRVRGIKTLGTKENLAGHFYVGSGSWYGNDSIWRMVYDLNMIILYGSAEGGKLRAESQRAVVSIMDGLIAGEGNGPLQPLPVQAGALLASRNPFLIDFAMAKLMGFDWQKIRLLANYRRFPDTTLSDLDPNTFAVILNGERTERGLDAIPLLRPFLPSPGWKGHIELGNENE